uniref:Helicase C-terminal domain-containing protein n=1 Tax=Hemiselmis andersenii TaxID=464988 RepID=A0A6U5CJ45_HEMAN|mmetsp:Transcript_773/g.1881  ORF Transcript_773/g.1881 Transcript_773/m.1881 type:complete len:194 (+) Transcript_773:160-741(+)
MKKKNKFSLISKSIHEYIFCPSNLKLFFLKIIIQKQFKNLIKKKKKNYRFSIIVFVPSGYLCEYLKKNLEKNHISSIIFYGKMENQSRLLAIQMLKNIKTKLIICTELGSRGLNLPAVDFIINFNFPPKISSYIHRAGRTSRFFGKGKCINLISEKEIEFVHFFEKHTGIYLLRSKILTEYQLLKILSNQFNK